MAIAPLPLEKPTGNYVVRRGRDTQFERLDAEAVLSTQGCKRFRHDPQPDGTLLSHGWLREE